MVMISTPRGIVDYTHFELSGNRTLTRADSVRTGNSKSAGAKARLTQPAGGMLSAHTRPQRQAGLGVLETGAGIGALTAGESHEPI